MSISLLVVMMMHVIIVARARPGFDPARAFVLVPVPVPLICTFLLYNVIHHLFQRKAIQVLNETLTTANERRSAKDGIGPAHVVDDPNVGEK